MSRKPKRPLSAETTKTKVKHMNSEADSKRYDSLDIDKNNNLIKINKKRPEINRSISLTNSYDKRNVIIDALPPSKSLDNHLITTHKKPIAYLKNLRNYTSLPHSKTQTAVQTTSATSLSSANQSPKLGSIKASSFDTTIFPSSLSNITLNSIKRTPNFFSLRPRSVSDCSNCVLNSNLHQAHKAQHEFIKIIKHDREFLNAFKSIENEQIKFNKESKENEQNKLNKESKENESNESNKLQIKSYHSERKEKSLSSKKPVAKLNIGDLIKKFREKHRQKFLDRAPAKFKRAAICIDEYLFSWVPSGLTNDEVSFVGLNFD